MPRALVWSSRGAMREIEAHDIDAGGEHSRQHVRRAAGGTERGDDLGGALHWAPVLSAEIARASAAARVLRASRPRAASCLRGIRGTRRRRWRCSRCGRRRRTWRSPPSCRRRRRSKTPSSRRSPAASARVPPREGIELEHADRAVPDDRAGLGDDRLQRRDRSAARCRGSCRRRATFSIAFSVGVARRRELLGARPHRPESAPCPETRRGSPALRRRARAPPATCRSCRPPRG